jgi:peroxiredoxin-like protein
MHPYPHQYDVDATAVPDGAVTLRSNALPPLSTAPPPQFGGPGGHWSPETLLVGAAADCFVLTFRAVAAASKLAWRRLTCSAEGVLDRRDGAVRFTELRLRAHLVVAAGVDTERARRLLEKSESACLVTRSLALPATLSAEVTSDG